MNTATPLQFPVAVDARALQATKPASAYLDVPATRPLKLDSGKELASYRIAYETYGTLNAAKSNAILVLHALTGDQYVASPHPVTGKPGWWETMVGPGKPIDTDRFFVICPNVLGGCMGSTGPASINPETGKAWGLDFPVITIGDMVEAQVPLIDHLGIDRCSASSAAPWAACRCWHGPRAIPTALPPPCRSPPPPGTPRRTSPSTRSAGRP